MLYDGFAARNVVLVLSQGVVILPLHTELWILVAIELQLVLLVLLVAVVEV